MMRYHSLLSMLLVLACVSKPDKDRLAEDLGSLDLTRGDIALCGSGDGQFGTVEFSLSCSEKVRVDFNLATALLHSFEYTEAEKVFARVIDADPSCVMAYWGAAMCSFHPLWEVPSSEDLRKGAKIISLARSLVVDKSSREAGYIEAVAAVYDEHDQIDHATRLARFVEASERVYQEYPGDFEAAIFYALALRAAADPADKSFPNQKKAGEILEPLFEKEPNHPGIAHYLIHNYDYPELAELALPAARKYASIAAASAHAQHMPSHIFTRLGLWDEGIESNMKSISSAICYAENMGIAGHWDEELHALDYLVYAYLQKGDDTNASEQVQYLQSITEVFPQSFKVAYSFTAVPMRYALERRDWTAAMNLKLRPSDFPWEKLPWEEANLHFGKLLGAVRSNNMALASSELEELQIIHKQLLGAGDGYKANLVSIQIKASQGWLNWVQGRQNEAIVLLKQAADMEDSTEKHPVTPGEVLPARELLGDMYLLSGKPAKALEAYEANLIRHPNRFNGLYGAGLAAEKSNNLEKAALYYGQLATIADRSCERPQLLKAKSFLRKTG